MDLASVPFGLALIIAFTAGIVSFISPCVLPLVPAYIGYMSGRVTHTVSTQVQVQTTGGNTVASHSLAARFSTLRHGIAFVVGFTFVFVAFGLLLTAFLNIFGDSVILATYILARVGGIIIIFFGLHFMGVIPSLIEQLRSNPAILNNVITSIVAAVIGAVLILWGFVTVVVALPVLAIFLLWLVLGGAYTEPGKFWNKVLNSIETGLYTDTRQQMNASGKEGVLGSTFMGIVFAAGWTPCIGPVYGAVLNLAVSGTGADVAQAGILLIAYSLGLGIPFLLMTLLLDSAQGFLRRMQRHMHSIELASGFLLIVIGFIVATGQLQSLSQLFTNSDLGEQSAQLEEGVLDFFLDEESADENSTDSSGEAAIPSSSTGSIEDLAASSGPVIGLEVGNLAPNFTTTLDSGETIQLSDLQGQVVLLNFWATWCAPCRREMPGFEEAFQQYEGEGFTILAVNNGESLEDVMGFREELAISFPLALDEAGDIQDQFKVVNYPSSFILDKDGTIIARPQGAISEEQIQALLAEALS